MSSLMNVPALETGVIRLFAIDLPKDQIEDFRTPVHGTDDAVTWPLKDALGAAFLDEDFVEVFPVEDLESFGLAGYLMEGNDVPEDQIDAMRAQLAALKGYVLLVFSSAFSDTAQTLTPRAPLRHIGTFFSEGAPVKFEQLPSQSADPNSGVKPRKTPSDAAMSGRIATYALLFIFLFTALFIWIAA